MAIALDNSPAGAPHADLPTIGFFGINMGPCASPAGALRASELAEELGYDSVWAGEHVVAPSPRTAPSPVEPDFPILDPLVTLALVAGRTRRVRLATGIIILPQRNPVVLAKELASLDVLAQGRFVFGMGVGYVEPEMRAVGVPMAGRGDRADEYLKAMRALWNDPAPAFHGRYVDFAGIDAHPRPVQSQVPVIVGGHGRAALRRTVRHGNGWYGFLLDRRTTAEHLASLRREAEVAGREFDELTISVSPSETLDREIVRDYANLGVHRLVVVPRAAFRHPGISSSDLDAFIRANAPERVGARPDGA